jgi:uncharacterized protein (DUF58 family)
MNLQSAEFLKALKMLTIKSKHDFPGQRIGERKTNRKGGSVEFKDFKEYDPGDDIRFIDWNLWARLDKLFIKIFHNEENQNIFILFDTSRSMKFGTNSKWEFMLSFVAAISYVSLHNGDFVKLYPFATNINNLFPLSTNPGNYPKMISLLEALEDSREADLINSVTSFLQNEKKKGILFVVSDFFYNLEEIEAALKKIRWHNYETTIIQVLAEEEIEPPYSGLLELIDAETNKSLEIELNAAYRLEYQRVFEEHTGGVAKMARKYGMGYFMSSTGTPFHEFILRILYKS